MEIRKAMLDDLKDISLIHALKMEVSLSIGDIRLSIHFRNGAENSYQLIWCSNSMSKV
jgi:hypothetical protein